MEGQKNHETDIATLLETWQMPMEVIEAFHNNGITRDHLDHLTQDHLKEICPQIGNRIKLTNKINKYLESKEIPLKKKRLSCESDTISLASTSSATTLSVTSNTAMTLEQLLDTTDGKMILSSYKCDKQLNDFYRQKLADEIIKHELKHDIGKSFPNSVVEYWSDLIISYFKGECYEVWAGCTKGKNRQSAAGRGILLNRYYNFRRKLSKVGLLSKTPQKTDEVNTKHIGDIADEDEHDDLILWLQNTKTVNLVIKNWERTTVKRLTMLKGSTEIHQYMDDFPAIKCVDGYRLLEIDFQILYPEAVMQLYGDWPIVSTFIMSKLPIKEQNSINDCCAPDGKKLKTLRALTHLFPIKNIVMKKKQQWRPSKLETKDALCTYVKSVADIQPAIQRKKEKFFNLGLHLGPQLFAVSQDEDNIAECYLVINSIMYNFESPLKAFDVYFKAFHALNCFYPKEAERELYFLQRAVYNVQCDTDQIRDTKIIGLIGEYNKYKPC